MQRQRFDYLLQKELTNQLSREEREELTVFLKTYPEFWQEYQLLKLYWLDKRSHSGRDQELFQQVLRRIDVPPVTTFRSRILGLRTYAALFIAGLMLLSVVIYATQHRHDNELSANRTQRTITLEDGTEVILNAKSTLYYPDKFEKDKRAVRIIGEAFFQVAKDKDRPFIIETDKALLRVIGTSLNIRAYPDEQTTEASLIEGSLEVTAIDTDDPPVLLRPSEKITLRNKPTKKAAAETKASKPTLSRISYLTNRDSIAVETTWIRNKLAFKDVPFEDLAKVLERKYDVQFAFTGKAAAKLRFTASFDKEDIPQMLAALQLASSFGYHIDNNTITIMD